MLKQTIAAGFALAAITTAAHASSDRVEALVETGQTPAAVLLVLNGDEPILETAAGCEQLQEDGGCAAPMTVETKFRVASISKMAVGFAALSMARDGLVDLDADVSDYLIQPLRNDAYPDAPITLRHLLSHTATVRDPDQYWVAAPGALDDLLEEKDIFAADDGAPGAYFTYANLNFGLAAGALERASGERFDQIVTERIAKPLDLDIGFNWSGVSRQARRKGATLYRQEASAWVPQTDSSDILEADGPYFLAEESLDRARYLKNYEPGDNPTLFSPQGGLRASARDLARLVAQLRPGGKFAEAASPVWRFNDTAANGDTLDGLMPAYGLGVHEAPPPDRPERNLVGHSGEAYGLFSGAWVVQGTPYIITYAVTGSAIADAPGEIPGFTGVEKELLDIAFDAIDADAPGGRDFAQEQQALLDEARERLAANPDDASAAVWVGRRLGYLGRYDEAIDVYRAAWAMHPTDARFPRHIGHRQISLRRFDEAIETFEKAAALTAALPDMVEPDGLPNAENTPTSTLKGNIYYHLGLAHYFTGDFDAAARGFEGASALAHNPDAATAARYWLYLSLARADKIEAAKTILDAVDADWSLIENKEYHELALCLRGDMDCDDTLERARNEEGIGFATPAYGVAMSKLIAEDKKAARKLLEEITDRGPSAAFGHIAAEADLAADLHQ